MPSILIVDDEYGLADMAGELLALAGHQTTTAINGKLALDSVEQQRPDVILLDVMMPILSGPETLRILKTDASTRDIPVVMMSAAGPEILAPDIRSRIAGFLQKPFTYEELLAAITNALRSSAARPPASS